MASALLDKCVVPHFVLTSNMAKENPDAVRNVSSHLSDKEREVLEQLLQRAEGKPSSILLMENHHAHGAAGHRGAVYVYAPNDKVVAGAPFVDSRFFDHVLMLPLGDTIDEAVIHERMKQLHDLVKPTCARPWRLSTKDSVRWDVSLGTHGNFVQVMRHNREISTPTYYLKLHTDAGQAGADLYEKHIASGTLTFAKLLAHPDFAAVRSYSHRNAKRVLALAARLLEVPFVTQDDNDALVEGYEAPPRMALPWSDVSFNTFHRRTLPDGRDAVVFYSLSAALDRDVKGPMVPYLVNPLYGSVMYKASPKQQRGPYDAPFINHALNAFPMCSGPVQDAPSVQKAALTLRSQKGADQYASRTMHWHGKGTEESALVHPSTYRYRAHRHPLVHEEALGAREGSIRLYPVNVYQAPPQQVVTY